MRMIGLIPHGSASPVDDQYQPHAFPQRARNSMERGWRCLHLDRLWPPLPLELLLEPSPKPEFLEHPAWQEFLGGAAAELGGVTFRGARFLADALTLTSYARPRFERSLRRKSLDAQRSTEPSLAIVSLMEGYRRSRWMLRCKGPKCEPGEIR